VGRSDWVKKVNGKFCQADREEIVMTKAEAKKLYIGAGGPDYHSDFDWASIHKEMQAIVEAKTDLAAGRTIDWWGCWDKKLTATGFARRVRALYAAERKT